MHLCSVYIVLCRLAIDSKQSRQIGALDGQRTRVDKGVLYVIQTSKVEWWG